MRTMTKAEYVLDVADNIVMMSNEALETRHKVGIGLAAGAAAGGAYLAHRHGYEAGSHTGRNAAIGAGIGLAALIGNHVRQHGIGGTIKQLQAAYDTHIAPHLHR